MTHIKSQKGSVLLNDDNRKEETSKFSLDHEMDYFASVVKNYLYLAI